MFQTITTDGYLKKPSVHQGRGQALIVLTMIRVLAFTLTLVFFHSQVRSHVRSCSFGFAIWLTVWRISFSLPLGRIPVLLLLSLGPSKTLPRNPFNVSLPPAKRSDLAVRVQQTLNQAIIGSQRLVCEIAAPQFAPPLIRGRRRCMITVP